jgi:hypothetical protein
MMEETGADQRRMVTGMFRDPEHADQAYRAVRDRGYEQDDVSLLMSDDTRDRLFNKDDDEVEGEGSKALEGVGAGSAIGGTLGAIIGGVAAVGTSLVIPGLGLVIAGPIAAALAGAGAGGGLGALIGGLIGAGIPEERAKVYEEGIREGGIVMGVHPRTEEDARYIQDEWQKHNAEHVEYY